MRRMREFWPGKRPPRTVYVGSHEDKLSRLRPMHVDPDDDGRTREDREGHGSPFDIPVPLPRVLEPRGRRKKRD
jgi:hypothetical protein